MINRKTTDTFSQIQSCNTINHNSTNNPTNLLTNKATNNRTHDRWSYHENECNNEQVNNISHNQTTYPPTFANKENNNKSNHLRSNQSSEVIDTHTDEQEINHLDEMADDKFLNDIVEDDNPNYEELIDVIDSVSTGQSSKNGERPKIRDNPRYPLRSTTSQA